MNRYSICLGLLAGLVGLGIFLFARRPLPPSEAPPALKVVQDTRMASPAPSVDQAPPPSVQPSPLTPQAPSTAQVSAQKRPRLTIKAGAPIPELFPHQAERDRLMALATTYDAKNVPVIAPSLAHSDATVREAARQALLQIGDASAIPYLKKHKSTTKDPEEAELIQEAINFLSLPHVIDVLTLNAKAAQAQQP